jgi:hypothetical protein
VQANATFNLAMALQNGDSSYDPTSAITVYYVQVFLTLFQIFSILMDFVAQARNEIAAANAIMPITTNLLQKATSAYATYSAQRYLAQIRPDGTINATAFGLLANAPQALTPAVGWTTVNLRPYTSVLFPHTLIVLTMNNLNNRAPVATAVTLVGQIFIIIFT